MTASLRLFTALLTILTIHTKGDTQQTDGSLSPQEMGKLISTQNAEGYPLVECSINNLPLIIQTRPDWGPLGQQRFMELVEDRYYDGAALFRAINNFIVQFGLASTSAMRDKWAGREHEIQDDPKIDVPFTRGIMSFAGGGANTRGTQIFITLAQLSTHLGREVWEVPFGRMIYGEPALQSINTEYDDNVSQGRIWRDGYDYLKKEFPNLSYIQYCRRITDHEVDYYLKAVGAQKAKQPQVVSEEDTVKKEELNDARKDADEVKESSNAESVVTHLLNNTTLVWGMEIAGVVAVIAFIVFAAWKVSRQSMVDKDS
eukprot:CAMPEP_0197047130 /NCGR_PEP_ID=MMETSP1384-20130603/22675_1 /TAXON_ID=29189 /ORGANISM="Ammonia sp." /LENGTH=314 /DNA_ID=CAMNT_0042479003 /DNA_START=31 /DNA_END=975 /DNA_ORIENTATION=-